MEVVHPYRISLQKQVPNQESTAQPRVAMTAAGHHHLASEKSWAQTSYSAAACSPTDASACGLVWRLVTTRYLKTTSFHAKGIRWLLGSRVDYHNSKHSRIVPKPRNQFAVCLNGYQRGLICHLPKQTAKAKLCFLRVPSPNPVLYITHT